MAQSYERYKSFFKVTCGHYGSQIQNANACLFNYQAYNLSEGKCDQTTLMTTTDF